MRETKQVEWDTWYATGEFGCQLWKTMMSEAGWSTLSAPVAQSSMSNMMRLLEIANFG
jgi:hypothetical protein